jgi:hypothetical protein
VTFRAIDRRPCDRVVVSLVQLHLGSGLLMKKTGVGPRVDEERSRKKTSRGRLKSCTRGTHAEAEETTKEVEDGCDVEEEERVNPQKCCCE